MNYEEESNIEDIENDGNIEEELIEETLFKIRYWNTTYTFQRLAELFDKGKINVPDLQRGFVWNKEMASKLIDSIILGIPLPNFFFYRNEDESNDVIDGLQRVMTISTYISGEPFPGEKEAFKTVDKPTINKFWRNKSFQELSDEYQDRIKDAEASIIFFEQRYPNTKQNDIKKYVFERINTGGIKLTPQEIRNALYPGVFLDRLKIISSEWNDLELRFSDLDFKRYKIDELVLRICTVSQIIDSDYNLLVKEDDNAFTSKEPGKTINLKLQMDFYMEKNKSEIPNQLEIFSSTLESFYEEFSGEFNYLAKNENSQKINSVMAESFLIVLMKIYSKGIEFSSLNKSSLTIDSEEEEHLSFSKRTTNITSIQQRLNIIAKHLLNREYKDI